MRYMAKHYIIFQSYWQSVINNEYPCFRWRKVNVFQYNATDFLAAAKTNRYINIFNNENLWYSICLLNWATSTMCFTYAFDNKDGKFLVINNYY